MSQDIGNSRTHVCGFGSFVVCGWVLWVRRWVGSRRVGSRVSSRRSSPVAASMIADVEVLDEDEDVGSGVGSSDADVVEPAVDAQGDRAGVVDAVVADAVVGVGAAVAGGGFGSGVVGGGGGGVGGAGIGGGVGGCSGRRRRRGGPGARRWWRAGRVGRVASSSGSAGSVRLCRRWWGGWGGSSSGSMPRRRSSCSRPLRPPCAAGEAGGEDHAVVGQRGGRDPVGGNGLAERGRRTIGPVTRWWAVTDRA